MSMCHHNGYLPSHNNSSCNRNSINNKISSVCRLNSSRFHICNGNLRSNSSRIIYSCNKLKVVMCKHNRNTRKPSIRRRTLIIIFLWRTTVNTFLTLITLTRWIKVLSSCSSSSSIFTRSIRVTSIKITTEVLIILTILLMLSIMSIKGRITQQVSIQIVILVIMLVVIINEQTTIAPIKTATMSLMKEVHQTLLLCKANIIISQNIHASKVRI